MATNYYDNILERMKNILESEFEKSIKIYKQDRPNLSHNSICLIEGLPITGENWSKGIDLHYFPVEIILRHKWQEDSNKKEWLNRDGHKINCSLLANRSDTNWMNGYITDSTEILTEYDENENSVFWIKTFHWIGRNVVDSRSICKMIFKDRGDCNWQDRTNCTFEDREIRV